LIAGPPFVRALNELCELFSQNADVVTHLTPADVHQRFLRGESGLAISWPHLLPSMEAMGDASQQVQVGFLPLPGTLEIYHPGTQKWERRTKPHRTTLLGIGGEVASVLSEAVAPQEALRFLGWICGPEWAGKFAGVSDQQAPTRRSQLVNAAPWLRGTGCENAAQSYVNAFTNELQVSQFMFSPRIPGRMQYLSALDVAVMATVRGEETPEKALNDVASSWNRITEQLGKEEQLSAYRKSLGLE